jgi:hypothetical protein
VVVGRHDPEVGGGQHGAVVVERADREHPGDRAG